ncbi:S-adenosyl-L-methionine dependent methyltransferase [Pilatotrama ljubarskyi]|nr:S-adenosyl-L-methionine dependent methyltransferase [Pilatotrama ljubarskyi]
MDPSATIYTKLFLRLYSFIVLTLSNSYAWCCPTRSILLPFYVQHIGEHAHLEIGVGTGYYPAASVAELSKVKLVTLVDLNPNTLAHAKTALSRAGFTGQIDTVEQSIFDPLPQGLHGMYDSIALYYLFHCLPGAFPKKATDVFANVIPALAPGGTVYGSTVLGRGVAPNWIGRQLLKYHNHTGVFSNLGDSEGALREALGDAFLDYDVRVVGLVALFWARNPKAATGTRG